MRPARRGTVLTNRAIVVSALLVVLAAVAAAWLLLGLYGTGSPADRARLDAIRTVGTVVLGAGGAIALLLAARRQQTAEQDLVERRRDLELKERVQAHTEEVARVAQDDASQRRITELYTSAVAQLGADSAPVRLGGLYAMERLAQDNESQRQTIVNVLCAYLRMPFPMDPDRSAGVEEREVRLAAQRILAARLRPAGQSPGWTDIDLDLTGATLVDFELRDAQVRHASFRLARLVGVARFNGTAFTADAEFDHAQFEDGARFGGCGFGGRASFENSLFQSMVAFGSAHFGGPASFHGCYFGGATYLEDVTFSDSVTFADADFRASVSFLRTSLGTADFDEAMFADGSEPQV